LPPFSEAMSVLRKLGAAGFKLVGQEDTEIGFIEVTSKTLLKEGQIEFPASITQDIPVTAVQSDLDTALTDADGPRYLIIFDTVLAKANRRVLGIKKMPSKILTGYREEPNPEYNIVQNKITNARLKVQQASMGEMSAASQYCQGMGCLANVVGQIVAASVTKKAQKKLNEEMEVLAKTSMTLKFPVYQKYKYDKAKVKATKVMTVHYYILDTEGRTYFKSTFDIEEKETFEVIYRVHDDDPKKKSIIDGNPTENDVVEWEDAAVTVKLTQLVDNYIENANQSKPLPQLVELRTMMQADNNRALAKYEAENYGARPLNDSRFDHIVVIYNPQGSLGSGFFIKPDIVLTNWHVVDEQKFVEMKTYDGQETFGKILAKDVRLDLALIKVQTRGKPVKFYTDKNLNLGSTLEAIGHPKRLEFSITRGVVSAVRRRPALSSGGKEVLFIQTDAPINTGNSGGPLFLGDKVVGVNSWGKTKKNSEGLNFAVHYSEILNFLRSYLPSFQVSKR
jgi:serine protease Do